MSRPKIAVLGLSHDHVWSELRHLVDSGQADLVGGAEPDAELRERFAKEHPGVDCHDQFDTLLSSPDGLDAVYLFSDNRASAELGVRAAGLGLHCLVEKPMAADEPGADAFLSVVKEAGVHCMVNWPFAWWPQLQEALRLVETGAIGRIWQVSYRAAHQGPAELGCSPQFVDWLYDSHRNGAGAFMDYCCYGAVLARTVLGMPEKITGFRGNLVKENFPVEDNGLLVMEYPDAIATAQASWTQIDTMTSYTTLLYGEKGTLLVGGEHGGELRIATAENPAGTECKVPDSPPHLRNSALHFLALIRGETEVLPLCDPVFARDAQEILSRGLA